MDKIFVDKLEVFYQKYICKNNKGTFVILHGRGGNSKSWEKISEMLKNDGYNVYVPDIPGFGRTKINKIYTVDSYAKLIIDFCKKLDLKKVILLGHSNGGRISIKIANKEPKLIKHLILNNSAGIKIKANFKQKVIKKVSKILKKISFLPGYNLLRKILYKLVGGHDYLNLDNKFIKQTFLNMINSDLTNELRNIDLNTLLIWGEKDTYTPLHTGETMHRLINNSKLIVLKNQKHGIHLFDPEILFKNIIKYVNDN